MFADYKVDLAEIRANPFAWPGGYPRYAIMDDGGMLCRDCVNEEEVHEGGAADGWRFEGADILWEGEEFCTHCGKILEPAYETDDDEENENV